MRFAKSIFVFLILFSFPSLSRAQQKNALIIGINNYYTQKGIPDPAISLKGCVNDAKLMKGMLMNKFSFKNNEITEIYNDKATRNNILAAMNELLARSGKGDYAVVYYSGHGMLLKNSFSDKDFVMENGKVMGHNQGILTSDLYEPKASLIRDHEISRLANRFIDKGVVLTMIFDCCYSQSLMRGENEVESFPWSLPVDPENREQGRSVDMSRLPDEATASVMMEGEDSLVVESRNIPYDVDIRENDRIVRPAERPASGFLYYAASIGLDKSYERMDINNIKHGVFTQSLCEILKQSPASITLAELHKRILNKLNNEQFILPEKQNPNLQSDAARLKTNLLAMPAKFLSDDVTVNYIRQKDKDIIVDGGASSGLNIGNQLTYASGTKKIVLSVSALIGIDSAVASVQSGDRSILKPGIRFKVSNWFAQTPPLLKVYVPDDNCTVDQLLSILKEKVMPLKSNPNAVWFDRSSISCFHFYCTADGFYVNDIRGANKYPYKDFNSNKLNELSGGPQFFINLPVPTAISKAVKEKLSKDQNVILVDDFYKADAYLYCGYSAANDQLMFTFSNDLILAAKSAGSNKPPVHFVSKVNKAVDVDEIRTIKMNDLVNDISKVILQYASYNRWLNKWPKR